MARENDKTSQLIALLAAIICILAYLPAVRCGFINYDDPEYVLNNPVIRQLSPDNLRQMFIQAHVGWWMPLTWLSLAIDHHFWGLDPVGYHLTNIVLHAANTALVVLITDRLLGRGKSPQRDLQSLSVPREGRGYAYPLILLFTGLFWGIHPLRVESVAWVTERKDVLNGLFSFLSLLFYLNYAGQKSAGRAASGSGPIFYGLSLLCFACSLMAKSVSVVLPAMMLVLDLVPLDRLRYAGLVRLIAEKWPFWLVSGVMIVVTMFFAAKSQYLVSYEAFPLAQRGVVSGNAIWEYGRMTVIPFRLNPFNVIPDPIPLAYTIKASLVAIALAWLFFAGKSPRLAACLLIFLFPLLPVLAFFQNGDQSYADRFTYLPSLSPSIFLGLFAWNCRHRIGETLQRRLLITLPAALLLLFMILTVQQQRVWRSSETFWSRIIQVEPLAIIYKERAKLYHSQGRYAEAVADYTSALTMIPPTMKPFEYNFYAFRGASLSAAGLYADAVRDFTVAISLFPYPGYYYHRGVALRAMGKMAEAEADFQRAGTETGPLVWLYRN